MRPPVPQPIQIFRPGTHTAMSGATLSFSEDDLSAAADAYDPSLHEAPLVVGHPRHDAPAYGWVSRLQYAEGALQAVPTQVDDSFGEMVRKGRFKKVSASFYPPQHPANPKPGVYYLRHVGFLGAQPPAVKGLKAVAFADEAEGIVTIEFADPDDMAIAGLFRRLREFFISKFGQETADQTLPGYTIDALQVAAAIETDDDAPDHDTPHFTEEEGVMPQKTDHPQSADFAEREAHITAREKAITDREAALERQAREAAEREAAEFAEQLTAQGRILPRDQAGVVALLGSLPDQELAFGEGDAKFAGTPSTWLRTFLQALPVQVDFAERAGAEDTQTETADFAAPNGYAVDPERLAMHRQVLAYQTQHNCDYQTALAAIGR